MNLTQIETEALHLPAKQRAILAHKLLLNLDSPPESEIEETWLVEAQRRATSIDEGVVQTSSAEEVKQKAQALLR